MSRPWMPLYIADYLADTAHLGALQSGAYMHLIMHYWQHGSLPGNDAALMRIARLTQSEWKRERATISSFFYDGWMHKRIDEELAHAADISSKRRASAEAKHRKRDANAELSDTHAGAFPQPPSPKEEIEPNGSLPEASSGDGEASSSKPSRQRQAYPPEFEAFWSGYPTSANMSKKTAFDVWKRLPLEDREAAQSSLPAFRAFCESKPDYQPVYADRYLRQRRFEGHMQTQAKIDAWEAMKRRSA